MQVIRQYISWLLSNPVGLVAALAILAILLSQCSGGDVDHAVDKAKTAVTAEGKSEGEDSHAHSEGEEEHSHEVVESDETEVEDKFEIKQAVGDGVKAATAAAAGAAATVAAVTASGDEGEDQTESEASSEEAQAEGGNSPEELLSGAREAYWSNELDRSAELYQALIEQDDHPSHLGELANVYWKQNKADKAVGLYEKVVPWLHEQGRQQDLMAIQSYFQLVAPDKVSATFGNLQSQ